MAETVDRQPITVIEINRPITLEEAEMMKERFKAEVDDRPVLVTTPSIKVYQVEEYKIASARARLALIISVIGIAISICGLIISLSILLR
jgi:hypothetical protein